MMATSIEVACGTVSVPPVGRVAATCTPARPVISRREGKIITMTRGRPGRAVDTTVPAVVLRMVADDSAYGQLAVVRSLARLGVDVRPVVETRWVPGALSRHGRPLVLPFGEPPPQGTLERLLRVGRD